MDFDSNISKLEGIILSLRRRGFLTPGSDLCEEALNELRQLFHNIQDDRLKLKLVFFIVLNTEVPISETLSSNENLAPLMCLKPPFSRNFTGLLISKLNLLKEFNQIIENCSSGLTVSLLESSVKYMVNSVDNLNNLCNLWRSLFVKIHNVQNKFQEDGGMVKLSLIFQEMYEKIGLLLRKYKGVKEVTSTMADHLLAFFRSLLFMVRLYNDSAYRFVIDDLFDGTVNVHLAVDVLLLEPSKTCLNVAFASLPSIVDLITVDMWMSLSEVSEGTDSNMSAQEIIGEICYYLCEETQDVAPNKLKCLEGLKMEPKSKLERLMTEEGNLQDLPSWRDALNSYLRGKTDESSNVAKSSHFNTDSFNPFKDERFLNSVTECLNAVDFELLGGIVKECRNLLSETESSHQEKIRTLLLKALPGARDVDYADLFREIYRVRPEVGKKFQVAEGESVNFNVKLTKTFNQSSREKIPKMSELVCLCLESREKTLDKICLAAASGLEQAEFFAQVLFTLKDCFVADQNSEVSFLERALMRLIEEESFSEKEKVAFLLFFGRIENLKLVDWSLHRKILNLFEDQLKVGRLEKAIFYLELIRSGLSSASFDEFGFAFLVYLSQVLDVLSWNLESFSPSKCQAMELVGHIVSEVLTKAREAGSDGVKWALEQIGKRSEMTQARFLQLYSLVDSDWLAGFPSPMMPNLLLNLIYTEQREKVISRMMDGKCEADVRQSIILSLAMVLPRLTSDLWMAAYEALKVLCRKMDPDKSDAHLDTEIVRFFSSALYLLALYLNESPKSLPCYIYCLLTFGGLLRSRLLCLSEPHSHFILTKIIFVLRQIKDDALRETCSLAITPILEDLAGRSRANGEPESKLYRILSLLNVRKVEEAVRKKIERARVS